MDRKSDELKVDEAVENNPPWKPIVVLVALYEGLPVNGKAAEVIVMGDAPITEKDEQAVPLVHVASSLQPALHLIVVFSSLINHKV